MGKTEGKGIVSIEKERKDLGVVPELVKKHVFGKNEVMSSEGKYPAKREGAKRSAYKPGNFSSAI